MTARKRGPGRPKVGKKAKRCKVSAYLDAEDHRLVLRAAGVQLLSAWARGVLVSAAHYELGI